jgi:S-adenosylmethionine:tRNA ribosyltransferase-isomerase
MSYEKLSDYDFNLPDELIATHPAEPRDSSRLLVLDKKTGKIEHKHFFDIVDYLQAGDILVLNNSKVIPARLLAVKKETGGKVEVLLHKKLSADTWQCLIGGKVAEGLMLKLNNGLDAKLLKNNHDGTWDVEFNKLGLALMKAIEKIGEMPLPPYIVKQRNACHCEKKPCDDEAIPHKAVEPRLLRCARNDKNDYQTVFADDKKSGSVAAPTAGLHFTPELLQKIKNKGVKILEITLYVGMGTFAPVKVEDFTKHVMHSEWVEVSGEVINEIKKNKEQRTKSNPCRVIAVGTTSARSLEACWQKLFSKGSPSAGSGHSFQEWVDIFIYPGYKFRIVDAMITNFHLPKSTLLMLVSALAGKKNIDKAYREAIKKKYHFYSYGDAMFIK